MGCIGVESSTSRHLPVGEVAGELSHLSDGIRVGASHCADIELTVALLLHLRDHPLKCGAPAHCEEDL